MTMRPKRVRVGRHLIGMPEVRSLTDPRRPVESRDPPDDSVLQAPIDRSAVQHLDRVRAIYRPASRDEPAPGLERFIGMEDIFRRVGEAGMMQCPVHWPVNWVPLDDLEILEILDDQDIRAG
jgi:hypothetical protein